MPIRCRACRQCERKSRRRDILGAIPAKKNSVVAAIAVAIGNFAFVPDGKVLSFDMPAWRGCGCEVSILVERCQRDVRGVAITIEEDSIRQPGASDTPVLKKRNVF